MLKIVLFFASLLITLCYTKNVTIDSVSVDDKITSLQITQLLI